MEVVITKLIISPMMMGMSKQWGGAGVTHYNLNILKEKFMQSTANQLPEANNIELMPIGLTKTDNCKTEHLKAINKTLVQAVNKVELEKMLYLETNRSVSSPAPSVNQPTVKSEGEPEQISKSNGLEIDLPMIRSDIDIETYHKSEGISSSGINLILDCPARYYFEYFLRAEEIDLKLKEKYKMGRAVHTLVLEPDTFHKNFYCMEEPVNLTTKAGKEAWLLAEKEANGRDIIRANEWHEIKEMAAALYNHPTWSFLRDGKVEHSIFWKAWIPDEFATVLKSRPDIFTDDFIVDIKTTESIKAFPRNLYTYGYHRQAAMQIDALQQIDRKKRYFGFMVVEKKPPYLTACFELDEDSIELGRKEYLEGANLYSHCLKTNRWPGYSYEFQKIRLPKYLNKEGGIYNDTF